MEDKMAIKVRRYQDFENDILATLKEYSADKNLTLIRTGVTIDDDEMFGIVSKSDTIASFRVNKDGTIVSCSVNSRAFSQPHYGVISLFNAKDKQVITDYINSFEGMKLECTPTK